MSEGNTGRKIGEGQAGIVRRSGLGNANLCPNINETSPQQAFHSDILFVFADS